MRQVNVAWSNLFQFLSFYLIEDYYIGIAFGTGLI